MKKQNWFEDVFNLRPHFNQKIEQYIKQVIEVRYKEKGFLSDLEEDQLVERENEIYKQISTLFGGYWQDLDMAFDNPWEVFEDAWRCGFLESFKKTAADYFWWQIMGDICYAVAGENL